MWSVLRGVEVKSFKSFEDTVKSISSDPVGLVTFANLVLMFSFETIDILDLKELPKKVLGSVYTDDLFFVASNNISHVSVQAFSKANLSFVSTEMLAGSVAAFNADSLASLFLFGLDDGSVVSYSPSYRDFKKTVLFVKFHFSRSSLKLLLPVCAKADQTCLFQTAKDI
jgi:hypothetical protein